MSVAFSSSGSPPLPPRSTPPTSRGRCPFAALPEHKGITVSLKSATVLEIMLYVFVERHNYTNWIIFSLLYILKTHVYWQKTGIGQCSGNQMHPLLRSWTNFAQLNIKNVKLSTAICAVINFSTFSITKVSYGILNVDG